MDEYAGVYVGNTASETHWYPAHVKVDGGFRVLEGTWRVSGMTTQVVAEELY